MLIISPTAKISKLADIEDSTRGTRIVIEDGVTIDAFVKIKPAGGSGDVIIGAGSFINSGCVLYTGHGIRIGNNVLIASNCTLAPTNHEISDRNRLIRDQGFSPSRGGIVIEDDVWIGANSVLLDGAILRRGAVVGAGSVVRHELPEYSINVGAPARTVSWRT
jgi:virginiamycin A acetyltransferase